jgi:glycosyltransferase involved in cell wall biosynthesis
MRTRIVFVTTGLGTGGAENVLYRMLSAFDRYKFEPYVVSLGGDGPIGEKIRALDIPVHLLGMDAHLPNPFAVFELVEWFRKIRPHIVQTWMYHADLIGGLSGWLAGIPVVWGIRNTSLDPGAVKQSTILIARINAWLSNWLPRKIISCSETSLRAHIRIGFRPDRFVVIPNGFALDIFSPDAASRFSLRKEIGLDPDVFFDWTCGSLRCKKRSMSHSLIGQGAHRDRSCRTV